MTKLEMEIFRRNRRHGFGAERQSLRSLGRFVRPKKNQVCHQETKTKPKSLSQHAGCTPWNVARQWPHGCMRGADRATSFWDEEKGGRGDSRAVESRGRKLGERDLGHLRRGAEAKLNHESPENDPACTNSWNSSYLERVIVCRLSELRVSSQLRNDHMNVT